MISAVTVFVALAMLPGKMARQRNHPQADAINVAAWLGLLLNMGVVWVVAMIWAFTTPLSLAGQVLAARVNLLNLRDQRLQQRVDLHLAVGGDFETARVTATLP